MEDRTGSTFYMAPEVILGYYNNKCDIWSFGVVAFAILIGRFPFDDKDNEAKIPEKIIKQKI